MNADDHKQLGDASTPAMKGSAFLLWVLLLTVIATGLRLYKLDAPSLWIDEVYTVRSASDLDGNISKVFGYVPTSVVLRAFGVPMDEVSMENVPEWQALGITEWRIRFAAVLFGIATIPLVGLVGRSVLGGRAALMVALLLAVAPWHIWMSQSGRFYSQQFMFASLCLLWYYHATSQRSRRSMVLSMLCLVLAFHSQPPALAIVGVFALDWVFGIVRGSAVPLGRFGWAAATTAMAICVTSFSIDGLLQAQRWEEFQGERASNWLVLALGPIWMIGPVTVVFAAFSAAMLRTEQTRQVIYWGLAGLVPIAGMIALSFETYVHFRYMFVCLMGWLVLSALGAGRLYEIVHGRFGTVAAGGPLAVLVVSAMLTNYAYYTDGYGFRDRWREAFEYVEGHRAPDDFVASGTKASYYLQDQDIVPLRLMTGPDDLRDLNRPTWIVFRAESPATPRQYRWLAVHAELKATFDRRIQEPFSSVRVYYFDPRRHGVTPE